MGVGGRQAGARDLADHPGVVTDVEANELFVVVSGRATVEVEGGGTLEVGPGSACVLREGDRTTWTVHETLRKAYHISY